MLGGQRGVLRGHVSLVSVFNVHLDLVFVFHLQLMLGVAVLLVLLVHVMLLRMLVVYVIWVVAGAARQGAGEGGRVFNPVSRAWQGAG